MAYPVLEMNMQNVELTIKGITTGAGYAQTLIVERESRVTRPRDNLAVIVQGQPTRETTGPQGKDQWLQPVFVVLYVIESETSSIPLDQRINIARCDVEKAVMIDRTRGGYAIDTLIDDPDLFDAQDGSFTGIIINLSVRYRTLRHDPYTLG